MIRHSTDRRNAINQRNQLPGIMAIGTGQRVAQRSPIRVRQDVLLTARFSVICRIWTGFPAASDGSDRRACEFI